MVISHAYPPEYSLVFGPNSPSVPSLTLTNPDMILPYRETQSSPTSLKSSPTFHRSDGDLARLPPPSTGLDTPQSKKETELSIAEPVMLPWRTNPINSGVVAVGYEHGAPLSDIGEEDVSPRSKRTRSPSRSPALPSSPTITSNQAQRALQRLSDRSKSVSMGGEDFGGWEDFDLPRTDSDRLKADLAANTDDLVDLDCQDSNRNSITSNGDDELSSVALSNRAERILASAKERLTVSSTDPGENTQR